MNAQTKIGLDGIDLVGCRHWSTEMPYRAIVPIRPHAPNGPILYQVAGSAKAAAGAEKALREAIRIHGAHCFYCAAKLANTQPVDWTLDHVEPSALGGKDDLPNLVAACKPCNLKKGHRPIDSFNPMATKRWLSELAIQIEDRLVRLK